MATPRVFLHNCVYVNSTADRQLWHTGDEECQEEFLEIVPTVSYIRDCTRFLPDPYLQAEKDIPRMDLRLNYFDIATVTELAALVPLDQLQMVLVVCTQVLWGMPYEMSVVGSQLCVLEKAPPAPCDLQLCSLSKEAPFRVHKLHARKAMRASTLDDLVSGAPPRFYIDMEVEMDMDVGMDPDDVMTIVSVTKRTPPIRNKKRRAGIPTRCGAR